MIKPQEITMGTAEEFVSVWQSSSSLIEVSKRLGLSKLTLSVRATRYRNAGIPLKKFIVQDNKCLDVAGLTKLATEEWTKKT